MSLCIRSVTHVSEWPHYALAAVVAALAQTFMPEATKNPIFEGFIKFKPVFVGMLAAIPMSVGNDVKTQISGIVLVSVITGIVSRSRIGSPYRMRNALFVGLAASLASMLGVFVGCVAPPIRAQTSFSSSSDVSFTVNALQIAPEAWRVCSIEGVAYDGIDLSQYQVIPSSVNDPNRQFMIETQGMFLAYDPSVKKLVALNDKELKTSKLQRLFPMSFMRMVYGGC